MVEGKPGRPARRSAMGAAASESDGRYRERIQQIPEYGRNDAVPCDVAATFRPADGFDADRRVAGYVAVAATAGAVLGISLPIPSAG